MITVVKALHLFDSPAVFHIIKNSGFGWIFCPAKAGAQIFKTASHCGYLTEDPGIAFSVVIHYSTMEFFGTAPSLSPLEILDTVGAVGHCLQGSEHHQNS